jgi:hypothetical protein
MRTFSHDELQELLGAFALNATDPEERDAIERHLTECPRCRAEVEDFREVAAMLSSSGSAAPEGVWDRIAGALEEAPPPLRLPLPLPDGVTAIRPSRRTVSLRVVGALAVAAALVIAVLGFGLVRDDSTTDLPDASLARAAQLARSEPGAVETQLTSDDRRIQATVVLLPTGQGYVFADDLPALDEGRTYQLWGAGPGPVVSLGVLGNEPGVISFTAAGGVELLMITDERAGGVAVSSNAPVATATVS